MKRQTSRIFKNRKKLDSSFYPAATSNALQQNLNGHGQVDMCVSVLPKLCTGSLFEEKNTGGIQAFFTKNTGVIRAIFSKRPYIQAGWVHCLWSYFQTAGIKIVPCHVFLVTAGVKKGGLRNMY